MKPVFTLSDQFPAKHPVLYRGCLLIAEDATLLNTKDMLIEALIPQIRLLATLIAANRYPFDTPSPKRFTDDADFLAARILVLGIRCIYLDKSLQAIFQTALERIRDFSPKHSLAQVNVRAYFVSVGMASNTIIHFETEYAVPHAGSAVENSLQLARSLPKLLCI